MKMHVWSVALAGLALATAGHAQSSNGMSTVTLTVPLQISNYAAPKAQLWCELLDATDRSLPTWSVPGRGDAAALGLEVLTVMGGSFNGTKTLGIQVPTAALPDVRGWRCILTTASQFRPDPRGVWADLQSYRALTPLAEIRGKF